MWQKLIEVLGEVRQGYQELLHISREKRAALVAVDMKGLEVVVEKEQKVLDRINKAEKQRQAVLKQLAQTEPRIHPDTKMTDIYAFTPSFTMAEQLRGLHEGLTRLIDQVQEAGSNNQILINGALNAVNYRLNQLGGSAVEPVYGGKGQERVSHSKNFDFKA